MSVSVSMPQLGESVTEGTVTRWLKREGDHVDADEPLLEVSTDKVDNEIPSPVSGVVRGITVAEDETVAVGAELAVIDEDGAAGQQQAAAEPAQPEAARAQAAPQEAEQPAAAEPEPAQQQPAAAAPQPPPAYQSQAPQPAAPQPPAPPAQPAAYPPAPGYQAASYEPPRPMSRQRRRPRRTDRPRSPTAQTALMSRRWSASWPPSTASTLARSPA